MGNVVETQRTGVSARDQSMHKTPDVDPAGHAARGQATELSANQARRDEIYTAQIHAGAEAAAFVELDELSPLLSRSRLMSEANLQTRGHYLTNWAQGWDSVRPQVRIAANAYTQLEVLGKAGIDWRHPDAHEADFTGGLGGVGLDGFHGTDVRAAKASLGPSRTASSAALDAAKSNLGSALKTL